MVLAGKLYVALLWHQHQPYYKDPFTGLFTMPWVRLHAIKDYVGMANLIAEVPEVRPVINLVPSLVQQVREYLAGATDTAMVLARTPADSLTREQAIQILDTFFMANWDCMINVYPRYRQLLAKRSFHHSPAEKVLRRFSTEELRDLQVWSNLAWFHPTLVEKDPELEALLKKGRGFSEAEKSALLDKELRIMAELIPLHRRLAESGQVELTATPFYHPIVPLLCNPMSARAARPDLALPAVMMAMPDDARAQVDRALEHHERTFGRRPRGMWPSEGSVSDEAADVFAAAGVEWIATDEEILAQSRGIRFSRDAAGLVNLPKELYRPYRLHAGGRDLHVVFRDHALSDLIGFRYYYEPPGAAAADLVSRLEAIRSKAPENSLALIALDGENCWEHYPNQGVEFLRELYRTLAAAPHIEMIHVSEYIDRFGPAEQLDHIFPGSWIHHSFSTWMGHWEKNRGWEFVAKAKQFWKSKVAEGGISPEQAAAAQEELYIAEGSDWFWWYGDDHSSGNDAEFDALFRKHVRKAYEALGASPPDELLQPIIDYSQRESWRPPRGLLHVQVDGRRTSFFEWLAAGMYEQALDMTTMQRSEPVPFTAMYFGFGADSFFVRLDPAKSVWEARKELAVELWLGSGKKPAAVAAFGPDGARGVTVGAAADPRAQGILRQVIEIGAPLALLGLTRGQTVDFFVRVIDSGEVLQRIPVAGSISLTVPADPETAYPGGEDLV